MRISIVVALLLFGLIAVKADSEREYAQESGLGYHPDIFFGNLRRAQEDESVILMAEKDTLTTDEKLFRLLKIKAALKRQLAKALAAAKKEAGIRKMLDKVNAKIAALKAKAKAETKTKTKGTKTKTEEEKRNALVKLEEKLLAERQKLAAKEEKIDKLIKKVEKAIAKSEIKSGK